MDKQKKIIIIAVIGASLLGALSAYLIKSAGGGLTAEQKEHAKTLCGFYSYDLKNPSAHASLGTEYHVQQWQAFEAKNGPTGAKNIDEFCAPYK
jgi:hypothetical protein